MHCACHKLVCTERILYESSATTADLPGTTASVVQTSARREDDWNVTNVADDSHGIDSSWHVILDVRCRALTKWMWASKARSVATQHSLGTQGCNGMNCMESGESSSVSEPSRLLKVSSSEGHNARSLC